MGAGVLAALPLPGALVVNRVPEERRGAAMGTFTAFFDLGVGVGSPIAGAAAALGGYEAAFLVAAGCALGVVAVALSLRGLLARLRSPEPADLGDLVDQASAHLADASRHIANPNASSASTRSTSTASKPNAAPRTSSTSW